MDSYSVDSHMLGYIHDNLMSSEINELLIYSNYFAYSPTLQ